MGTGIFPETDFSRIFSKTDFRHFSIFLFLERGYGGGGVSPLVSYFGCHRSRKQEIRKADLSGTFKNLQERSANNRTSFVVEETQYKSRRRVDWCLRTSGYEWTRRIQIKSKRLWALITRWIRLGKKFTRFCSDIAAIRWVLVYANPSNFEDAVSRLLPGGLKYATDF